MVQNLAIEYQNIGGKFSVFTNNFINSENQSQIIVFSEPNNFILINDTIFNTHKLIKSERVAFSYNKAQLKLISLEKEKNILVGVFEFKPEKFQICLIAFYFESDGIEVQKKNWKQIDYYLNKHKNPNRIFAVIGDTNQNILFDKNTKKCIGTKEVTTVSLQIKNIFESHNFTQAFAPNAKKKWLDICATNAKSYVCEKIEHVTKVKEKCHDCHRIQFLNSEVYEFEELPIEPQITRDFDDYVISVVRVIAHSDHTCSDNFDFDLINIT